MYNKSNNTTTDLTLTFTISSTRTTQNIEGGLQSDRFIKYIWNCTTAFATNTSHNFQINHTTTSINHPVCYLVVTYEFNASTTTSVMNSVLLPVEMVSPIDGTTSSDFTRGERELWIQEPATITTERVAFYLFYNTQAAIGGHNCRIGTGSFTTYSDAVATSCGGMALMVRNDSAFTLARGRNTLNFDHYRTDTTDLGSNLTGFFIVNYTSGKATAGVGAHNHTVLWGLKSFGTNAATPTHTTGNVSPTLPETDYFFTAVGYEIIFQTSGTAAPAAITFSTKRLSTGGEGGPIWEDIYTDMVITDPEVGVYNLYCRSRDLFKRWSGDPDTKRIDVETARPYRLLNSNAAFSTASWAYIGIILTYHSITYTVTGTVSNSAGGTVTIDLHRATSGEKVRTTSRSGNGSYSITWYDNTENVYTSARESSTKLGRSDSGTP
jgi:hypothetical protein